jgi:Tn3 transposase DDE domain
LEAVKRLPALAGGRATDAPAWNLKTSLVAVLVAEACNIGYTPVIDPDDEVLTQVRLVHVGQYYLRADTIAAPNAALIEARGWVPIVEHWGEGLLASCGSSSPSGPSTPGPRRSTTTSSAASPG